jgi:hypothetical protein
MLYDTGNIPHLSTGNLPSSHYRLNRNTSRMDEREKEIQRIETRMRECGYTPRGLSMKLFGKPDRLRNFFGGKSQNPRSDTYKAIIAELWPEESTPINAREIKEKELGLLKGLEMLIWALVQRGTVPKKDLEQVFNHQLREFRAHSQSTAAEVMDQLLDFLHSKSFGSESQINLQSPQPQQDQLKKKKVKEDRT